MPKPPRRRPSIRLAPSILAALACGALLACGGDDGGAGSNGGGAGSNGSAALDACSVVTQADATALFGQPAVRQPQSVPIVDPGLLGECVWTWDTEMSSQLLQFYVWGSPEYHSTAPDGAQTLPIGEQGYLTVAESVGIDAEWIQDDHTIVLSYFKIGPEAPELATQVEPMKALAQQVSDAL